MAGDQRVVVGKYRRDGRLALVAEYPLQRAVALVDAHAVEAALQRAERADQVEVVVRVALQREPELVGRLAERAHHGVERRARPAALDLVAVEETEDGSRLVGAHTVAGRGSGGKLEARAELSEVRQLVLQLRLRENVGDPPDAGLRIALHLLPQRVVDPADRLGDLLRAAPRDGRELVAQARADTRDLLAKPGAVHLVLDLQQLARIRHVVHVAGIGAGQQARARRSLLARLALSRAVEHAAKLGHGLLVLERLAARQRHAGGGREPGRAHLSHAALQRGLPVGRAVARAAHPLHAVLVAERGAPSRIVAALQILDLVVEAHRLPGRLALLALQVGKRASQTAGLARLGEVRAHGAHGPAKAVGMRAGFAGGGADGVAELAHVGAGLARGAADRRVDAAPDGQGGDKLSHVASLSFASILT